MIAILMLSLMILHQRMLKEIVPYDYVLLAMLSLFFKSGVRFVLKNNDPVIVEVLLLKT